MKTIKDAVEHYKGIYPATDRDVRDCIVYTETHGWTTCYRDSGYLVRTKQQFEDYVKEQKMKEQKYKYVNAGIKTVGEFIDRVMGGEKIYKDPYVNACFGIFEGKVMLYSTVWDIDEIQAELETLTTRQPIPWYEQEGVFPCLVVVNLSNINNSKPAITRVAESVADELISACDGNVYPTELCTPLTPKEAAKYGVEL